MRKWLIVAAVFGVLATPRLASAQNVVYACVGNFAKVVRIVGAGGKCVSSPPLLAETPIQWDIQGPPGARGTNGTNGTNVTITGALPKGDTHCANGGVSLLDGTTGTTYYLCNGLDGTTGLPTKPGVVGAWFGIARPCPTSTTADSPDHAAFCTAICGTCANAGILPPEIPMTATVNEDGTMIEDESGEIALYHTTGHGQWAPSLNDGLLDRAGTQRIKGTFLWMGQTPAFLGLLGNAVRTRFVTYSDPLDPDRMIGYVQSYFFPIASGGTVNVNPPTDPMDGNHIPSVDPLVSPLPLGCDLSKGCLGTYHFILRRIKEQ
jgi:hypothetical protein